MLKLYSIFTITLLSFFHSAYTITFDDLNEGFKLIDKDYIGYSLNQEIITPQGKIGTIRRDYWNPSDFWLEEFKNRNQSIEYRLYDNEEKVIAKTLMRSYPAQYEIEVYGENGIFLGTIKKHLGLLLPTIEVTLPSQKRFECHWNLFTKRYSVYLSSNLNKKLLSIKLSSLPSFRPMATCEKINIKALETCEMDPRMLLLVATFMSEANFLDGVSLFTKDTCPNVEEEITQGTPITIDDVSNGFELIDRDWSFNLHFDVIASNEKIGSVFKDFYKSNLSHVLEYILKDSEENFLAKAIMHFTETGVDIEIVDINGFSLGVIKENFVDSIYLLKREFTIISPSGATFQAKWDVLNCYYTISEKSTPNQSFAHLKVPRIVYWTGMDVTNSEALKQNDLHPHLLILATVCQYDEEYIRAMRDTVLKENKN